eukprot:6469826-Amphidinium_carterae.2
MKETGPEQAEGAELSLPAAPADTAAPPTDEPAAPTSQEEVADTLLPEELDEHSEEDAPAEHVDTGAPREELGPDEASQSTRQEDQETAPLQEGVEQMDEEEQNFRAESAAIRDLLLRAPPLQEPALIRTGQAQTQEEQHDEHPESPARQRRRQTYPYPTPQDWHQSGLGTYIQCVADTISPGECMVSIEGKGRHARAAFTGNSKVPRMRECRRRVTVDCTNGTVLEDIDLTRGNVLQEQTDLKRRWPGHVTHTETFLIYKTTPDFIGAQVTIKDTLAKELDIWKLPVEQLEVFTKHEQRGRVKEWKAVKSSGAVQVHDGETARQIRATQPHRIVPSRWLDKWKVAGPVADHGVKLSQQNWVDKRVEAKSRWIVQGFHDPDIDLIERSVPTPATGDVPMALQLMASHRMQAWTADCKSALMQSDKGMRSEPLYASPPPDGLPGEERGCLIELKTEVYGLVSGPSGWRSTLLKRLKAVQWKRHPLAPCVFLYFEQNATSTGQPALTGVLVVETDDLLGGSNGPSAAASIKSLTNTLVFGHFEYLQTRAVTYGGRLIQQRPDYSFSSELCGRKGQRNQPRSR